MPIAKVTQGRGQGRGAYLCLNYVLTKDQAELLETNCASETPEALAQEFDLAFQPHRRNGAKKHTTHNLAHFSIGFHASQETETLVAIAHRFMGLMGFDPVLNQYVLAQHYDTDDCHLHLVTNRIGLDGCTLDLWQSKRRAEVAMRTIEVEFGLPQLKCSWEVDIKAPTVAEVRRSRREGAPIPRQVMQATIERAVSGCRTLEALQTALQAEGMTLILAPILPEVTPSKEKRKGMQSRAETTRGYKEYATEYTDSIPLATAELIGHRPTSRPIPQPIKPGEQSPTDQPTHPNFTQPTPAADSKPTLNRRVTAIDLTAQPDQAPNHRLSDPSKPNPPLPTRYQLVYQWLSPNGKTQTFSASALGKRYTQRGLQERWGLGLQGREWVEWVVQQSVKALFADQLEVSSKAGMGVLPLPVPTVETALEVETAGTDTPMLEEQRQTLNSQNKSPPSQDTAQAAQDRALKSQSSVIPAPQTLVSADSEPTVGASPLDPPASSLTLSQRAAWQYYQAAWLRLEAEFTQATGLTSETADQFEVRVLQRARERWSVEQCLAMLTTTLHGQAAVSQGREAFIAYVQRLFDQVEKRQHVKQSVKTALER